MDMHLISPAEVKAMWPLMETGDLVGASWLPTDGQASPSDITQSLAKGARMHGAKLFEDVRVTGFEMKDGRITAVKTDQGDDRLREGRQLRRPMGAAGRRDGRHQRAAAAGQAPVHHHREDRRACRRRADDPRSRPAHLFQGRGRRPGDGRLRAEPAGLDDRRRAGRLAVPPVRRRLGPFRAAYERRRSRACRRWRRPASSR